MNAEVPVVRRSLEPKVTVTFSIGFEFKTKLELLSLDPSVEVGVFDRLKALVRRLSIVTTLKLSDLLCTPSVVSVEL